MKRYGRQRIRAALCAGALLSLTACYSTATHSWPEGGGPEACARSSELVPGCGVLWGVATQIPSVASLAQLESRVGRQFDMVYRFHEIGDVIPTDDERSIVASGRVLHISIDSGPAATGAAVRTWRSIASGSDDDALRRAAAGIASLGKPVFVTFDHEANQVTKGALGDPADFGAAWRHVHQVFDSAGADNAVWVWVMMGSPETLARAGGFWPGNRYVGWISWDVYNQSGCLASGIDPARQESFLQGARPFYRWVHGPGEAAGIDPRKPMMISEAGSVVYPQNADVSATWYAEIPGALAKLPGILAVGLWDHTGNRLCDYRFDDDPAVLAAVAQAGADPKVRPPNG